jgi:pyruvate-ferredoxin/flavodoxin oxidoreductase
MQTCFFKLAGVLPPDEAIEQIKDAIEKTYGKKGAEVVEQNFAAVDGAWPTCTRCRPRPQVTSLHMPPRRARRRARVRAANVTWA